MLEYYWTPVAKHLPGQHDQQSHAGDLKRKPTSVDPAIRKDFKEAINKFPEWARNEILKYNTKIGEATSGGYYSGMGVRGYMSEGHSVIAEKGKVRYFVHEIAHALDASMGASVGKRNFSASRAWQEAMKKDGGFLPSIYLSVKNSQEDFATSVEQYLMHSDPERLFKNGYIGRYELLLSIFGSRQREDKGQNADFYQTPVAKHLPGQHDQQAHAGKRGAGAQPGVRAEGVEEQTKPPAVEVSADEMQRRKALVEDTLAKIRGEEGPLAGVSIRLAGRGYQFSVAGSQMTAAGEYNPQTKTITLFDEAFQSYESVMTEFLEGGRVRISAERDLDKGARGVLAHEVMHHLFAESRQSFQDDYGRLVAIEKEYYDKGEGYKSPLKADDTLRTEYYTRTTREMEGGGKITEISTESQPLPWEKQFPVYRELQAHLSFDNMEVLSRSDGFTDYSQKYWKVYEEGGRYTRDMWRAVDETLADIAKIKVNEPEVYTNNLKNVPGFRRWARFHTALLKAYRYSKTKERRKGWKLRKPVIEILRALLEEIVWLDEDFHIVPQALAMLAKVVYPDGRVVFGRPNLIGKHLAGQHDQQRHAGLLHATTAEFETPIDREGFKAGSYFLLDHREHTHEHIKAALEEIIKDRVLQFGAKGTVGDPVGLTIYEVNLEGLNDNDTQPDWELPEDSVKTNVPIGKERIIRKRNYDVSLRNLLHEAYNVATRNWYALKREYETGKSAKDPGTIAEFIDKGIIPITSQAVTQLMENEDLLREVKARRGRRGLMAVLVKLKPKAKSLADYYQTPV